MTAQPESSATGFSIPRDRYEQLRAEQSLTVAFLAGLVAALLGAIAWATITVTTEYQIGYMAIAVGFMVGFAMRLGKGIDKIFGVLGAVFSLLGCVLGNVFSIVGFISTQEHLGLMETLTRINYGKIPELIAANFSAMDLVFYGIAVYEGYRFSFRRLTMQDAKPEALPQPGPPSS